MTMQDQADQFTRKIELERRRLEELDKAIQVAESKILERRFQLGGVNAAKEDDFQAQKQIKVLENRLDKALIKFNEALAKNKELREEIDNLRRERAVFDEIYGKLQRDLHEKKKEIANVIEISNIAYEARDQAQNEVAALRAQLDKEQGIWNVEVQEVQKQIELEKKTQDKLRGLKFGNLSVEEEDALKADVLTSKWSAGKGMAMVDSTASKAQNYDEVFAKIQAATGISEMDELVLSFTKAEDQNYSLFNFANDLNQDIERLEELVSSLQEEEKRLSGEDKESDHSRQGVIKELEKKLSNVEGKTVMFKDKGESGQKTLNALKAAISSIYNKMACQSVFDKELQLEGVTENNMVQLLGIIEQRGNMLLQIKAKSGTAEEGKVAKALEELSGKILGSGPNVPAGGALVAIHPPTTTEDQFSDDNDSDDELDDRPLTRNELEAKTIRNISKRDSRGARRQRHHKK
eukprot:CAMPEP_0196594476 /NCGR_PEP_ID=MMETSP1081-20130531/78490_1 /TAXON_ID=36882 /ORGANISM="Pyramimonas amylifera, Strain CCMP720" /LENGTH=463 /DNA_ID=CAMNT_0041918757 /DNA_START=9 /DNA_END=1400 /DNA_ORIENTATION=+